MTKARENSDYTGLQGDLALKSPVASPVFTGNVGIGVTPESWLSTYKALQIGAGGCVTGSNDNSFVSLNGNAYADSANSRYEYINSAYASQYQQYDGTHNFLVAPSGSADAAISWNTAMTIDNAGYVTKPLQPAFCSIASVQSNMALNSWQQIAFVNERFDQNDDFASSTFTAPVTGKYQLQVDVRLDQVDSAATYYQVRIATSNRAYHTICDMGRMSSDLSYWNFNLSVLADMDAGDTCVIEFIQANGTQQTDVDGESYFSGYLVC